MSDSVFIESWQGYPTDVQQGSDGVTAVWVGAFDGYGPRFAAGRFAGSRAMDLAGYNRFQRLVPQSQTFSLRFTIFFVTDLGNVGGLPTGPGFFAGGRYSGISLKNAVGQLPMFFMGHDNLGRPQFSVGGILLPPVVNSPQFQRQKFHHCELTGKCDTVANGGYLRFKLDGAEVFNTPVDYTTWTDAAHNEMNTGILCFEANNENYRLSDLIYYPDDTLRGEHTLWTGQINGNSAVSWTPLAGANYTNINELACDDDTTYNLSNTPGQTDLFTIPAIPATPTNIECVQVGVCWRKDDSGTRTAKTKLTDPAGNRDGANVNLTVTYGWSFDAYKTYAAASAWTKANLANTKPGYSLVV